MNLRRTGAVVSILAVQAMFVLAGLEGLTRLFADFFVPEEARTVDAYRAFLDGSMAQDIALITERLRYEQPVISNQFVKHPFLGYVPRPDVRQPCGPGFPRFMCPGGQVAVINDLGFYDDEFGKQPPPNTIRVAVVGGSVANLFVQSAGHQLAKLLSRAPALKGADVEVLNLAIPGHKQPQQLFAIAYLLTQGYRFDAVVDISGLNEVYLSRHYNMGAGVGFSLPFVVHWSAAQPVSLFEREEEIPPALLENLLSRAGMAALAPRRGWVPHSLVFRWLIVAAARKLHEKAQPTFAEFAEATRRAMEATSIKRPESDLARYVLQADRNQRCNSPSCTDEIVTMWEQSVRAMHTILAAAGTRYFFLLQPNPYMVRDEWLNPADLRLRDPEFGWSDSDSVAWRSIQAKIQALRDDDVLATDLNEPYVFKGLAQGVLVDACCHLNELGYRALAEAVAGIVSKSWRDAR